MVPGLLREEVSPCETLFLLPLYLPLRQKVAVFKEMHLCGACVAYVLVCMMLLIITSLVLDVTPYLHKGEHSKMSGLVLRYDEGRYMLHFFFP